MHAQLAIILAFGTLLVVLEWVLGAPKRNRSEAIRILQVEDTAVDLEEPHELEVFDKCEPFKDRIGVDAAAGMDKLIDSVEIDSIMVVFDMREFLIEARMLCEHPRKLLVERYGCRILGDISAVDDPPVHQVSEDGFHLRVREIGKELEAVHLSIHQGPLDSQIQILEIRRQHRHSCGRPWLCARCCRRSEHSTQRIGCIPGKIIVNEGLYLGIGQPGVQMAGSAVRPFPRVIIYVVFSLRACN